MINIIKCSLFILFAALLVTAPEHANAAIQIPEKLLGNRLSITVNVVTNFQASQRRITYDYTFNNSITSMQPLEGIALKFDHDIISSSEPLGWGGGKYKNKPFWSWGVVAENALLRPGSKINYLILQSEGLPGIQPYYAQGEIPIPNIDELPEDVSEQEFGVAIDIFHNSTTGTTVAPTSTSIHAAPLEIIDYLIEQTRSARQAGWIQSNGIVNSLIQKLQAARDSYKRRQFQVMQNQLLAFQNHVRAQSKKHISGNAVTILMTGSDVAIQKL